MSVADEENINEDIPEVCMDICSFKLIVIIPGS
jgi:hypothetical protein